jgi:hypothetical protein
MPEAYRRRGTMGSRYVAIVARLFVSTVLAVGFAAWSALLSAGAGLVPSGAAVACLGTSAFWTLDAVFAFRRRRRDSPGGESRDADA